MSLTKGTTKRLQLLLAALCHEWLAMSPVQVQGVVVPCSPDTSPAIQEPTPVPALCMRLTSATGMSHDGESQDQTHLANFILTSKPPSPHAYRWSEENCRVVELEKVVRRD